MIVEGSIDHGNAIARSLGMYFNPVCDRVIARVSGDELLGGVIFNQWTGRSICIHVSSFAPNWVSRDLLWLVFRYPFEQLEVEKLLGQISSGNSKAIAFNKKLGFIEEARIPGVYTDGDLVLMSMTRAQCRWLERI